MRCVAVFFLLIGAFLLEWHERGFVAACRELKVYWTTRNTYTIPENEENY